MSHYVAEQTSTEEPEKPPVRPNANNSPTPASLVIAFVSIGLQFSSRVRGRPVAPLALFASATVVNIVVALGLALLLFGDFTVG